MKRANVLFASCLLVMILAFVYSEVEATTVDGYVRDQDGRGIENVKVQFSSPTKPVAYTNSSGKYVFTAIDYSSWWSAYAWYGGKSYYIGREYVDGAPSSVVHYPELRITVSSSHKVYGYVKNLDTGLGEPGLKVILASIEERKELGSTTTSASGYYQFLGKATSSGTHRVSAWQDGMSLKWADFYVDTSKSSTRAPDLFVDLPSSGTTYSVSGTVTNKQTGAPVYRALVRIEGPGPDQDTYTRSDGSYSFDEVASDQDYTIFVSKSNFESQNQRIYDLSGPATRDFELVPLQQTYDLEPSAVSLSQSSYDPGQEIGVDFTIRNAGRANGYAFSTAFYASSNNSPSITVGDIPLGEVGYAGLEPGAAIQDSRSLPSGGLEPDTPYYVKLEVDSNDDWPGEYQDNNVLASSGPLSISEGTTVSDTRYLNLLKIEGVFTGADTDPQYAVDAGAVINDFLYTPIGLTVYTDSHANGPSVEWGNGELELKPSGLSYLGAAAWEFLDLSTLTLEADTGAFQIGTPTVVVPPLFTVELQDLTVNDYTTGGMHGALAVALPLSRKAMREMGDGTDVFATRPDHWAYLDASANFQSSGFEATFLGDNLNLPIFGNAFLIHSIGGTLDTINEIIILDGSVELGMLASGTTITLYELKLVDYYKPDTIDVGVEIGTAVPVIPFPGVPGAFILAFDELRVHMGGLFSSKDELSLGGGLGVVVGYVSIPPANLKVIRAEGYGEIQPYLGDFSLDGEITLFIYEGPPQDFDGYQLVDAKAAYYKRQGRFESEADLNLQDIFKAHGELYVDTDANMLTGQAEGSFAVPSSWPFIGGLEIGSVRARAREKVLHGGIKVVFLPGIGFRFNEDGSLDYGMNLYDPDAIGGAKTAGETYAASLKAPGTAVKRVPPNQPYAVIQLLYETGYTEATLTAPDDTQYDSSNHAEDPLSVPPVFYRENEGVEADGVVKNEICFFIVPEEGQEYVLDGDYTLNISDATGIGAYEVHLWLADTPPNIELVEPSTDVSGPSLVSITWTDEDPDDNAEILLFYDTDNEGYDGQLITYEATGDNIGPLPIEENDASDSYEWNTTGVPTGEYYVYAQIDDGKNLPVFSNYSQGTVLVVHEDAPEPPTNLATVAGAASIQCAWHPSTTTNPAPFYVLMYDDKPDNPPSEQFEHSIVTEDLTSWTIENLTYGRTYRVAVAAMNPETLDRSEIEGPVSVHLYTTVGNNAPLIVSQPITEARVGYEYAYQVTAEDLDGDRLLYELVPHEVEGHPELVSPPPGMAIDPDTGLITLTPIEGHLGVHRVEVRVSDGNVGEDTQLFYLSVDNWMTPNESVAFDVTPPTSVLVDSVLEFSAHATDPDGNQVIYSLQNAPVGMTIDPVTGLILWSTTMNDRGTYPDIVIIAVDGKGGSDSLAMPLTVEVPVIEADFTFNPSDNPIDPQPSPTEVVFTAQPNYAQYVKEYAWDFDNDGTPDIPPGQDDRVVRWVFSGYEASGAFPANLSHEVTLTVTAYGNPDDQTYTVTKTIYEAPPLPVADFDTVPSGEWTIRPGDLTRTFQQQALWATSYVWSVSTDTTPTITPDPFDPLVPGLGQRFPVTLTVTGADPSDTASITKCISYVPAEGTWVEIFHEGEGGDPDWPTGWHEATALEISEPLSSSFYQSTATPPDLVLTADEPGNAISLSSPVQLAGTAFDFTFRADLVASSTPSTSGVWYVDAGKTDDSGDGLSWDTAKRSIQAAIDAADAGGGGEVWAAEGVYNELRTGFNADGGGVDTGSIVMRAGVHLYGGFAGTERSRDQRDWEAHIAVLDGSTSRGGQPAYHVVVGAGDATLDGFVVTGGRADGGLWPFNGGAGVFNQGVPSTFMVANCVVVDNYASGSAGGISNRHCSPTVSNCVFTGNSLCAMANSGDISLAPDGISTPVITDCVFVGNAAFSGGGMYNHWSCPTVVNCVFIGNSADSVGGGMVNDDDSCPLVSNCTFWDNVGEGMYNMSDSVPSVTDCIVWDNSEGIINDTATGGDAVVAGSDVQGWLGGGTGNIDVDPLFAGGPSGTSTNLEEYARCQSILTDDNVAPAWAADEFKGAILIIDPAGTRDHYYIFSNDGNSITVWGDATTGSTQVEYEVMDLRLQSDSFCIDTGLDTGDPSYGVVLRDIEGYLRGYDGRNDGPTGPPPPGDGSDYDMGVHEYGSAPTVIQRVDATRPDDSGDGLSWVTAKRTIQAAIDALLPGGGEVWVAGGTYTPTTDSNRAISFRPGVGVSLYGGFSGTETSREQRDWETNVTILSGDIGTAGDNTDNSYNVVVTANRSRVDGFVITSGNADGGNGAGVLNPDNVTVEIRNCVLLDNRGYTGAGMYNGDGSSPVIADCIFARNTSPDGGGNGVLNAGNSSPTIARCVFVGNGKYDYTSGSYGGGIANAPGCSPTIKNCLFVDNLANLASEGGTVWTNGCTVPITNCTIIDNDDYEDGNGVGSAIYNVSATTATITNCILRDHEGPEIQNVGGALSTVTYCDVEGWPVVDGNIDVDPLFAGGPAGTSTDLTYAPERCQSTLTHSGVSPAWSRNQFRGAMLVVDPNEANPTGSPVARGRDYYVVVTNDADSITVWGDATKNGTIVDYEIRQFTLEGAPCIDTGRDTSDPAYGSVLRDMEGSVRGYDGRNDGRTTGDGSDYDMGAYEVGQPASQANAYVVWSENDFLRIAIDDEEIIVHRISSGVADEEARCLVEGLSSNSAIGLRYDGVNTFQLFVDDVARGDSWTGTPGSSDAVFGLGFYNISNTTASQTFHEAVLQAPNDAPSISFGPPPHLSLVSGAVDVTIDLDDYIDDDLTPDSALLVEFPGPSSTWETGALTAAIDATSHVLTLQAAPGLQNDVSVTMQITVTDEQELSASAELNVEVGGISELPHQLFSNIASTANVDDLLPGGAGSYMKHTTGSDLTDIIATHTGTATVYANAGGNLYNVHTDLTTSGDVVVAALGDYDNDGDSDVFMASETQGRLYENDGAGGFTDETTSPLDSASGKDCVWTDIDSDGDLDLYVVRNGDNALYVNDGGSFSEEGAARGLNDSGDGETAVFADIDLDGDPDCYVTNVTDANRIYVNDSLGFFSPYESHLPGSNSYGAVFADFNNDGYPDLYVANDGSDNLFLNNGDANEDWLWDGGFTPIPGGSSGITNDASSGGATSLDYDNNGYLDIFVSNYAGENVLYHNNGDGTFTDVDTLLDVASGVLGPTNGYGMGAATGDIDNDGDVDIWQVNADGQPAALFENNLIGQFDDQAMLVDRNWIEVRLMGTTSNTSAIGARVEIWKDHTLWQTRQVHGGSGWRSQDSLTVHLGLGDDAFAEEIVVYWPGGNVSRHHWEPANQIVQIVEERALETIVLSPGRVVVPPGETVQVSAEAIYTDGDTELLNGEELYWQIDDPSLAYVDGFGTVLGLSPGATYLTARTEGIVSQPAEIIVASATVTSITLTPATVRIAVGETQHFAVIAHYDDGSSEEVTPFVTWFVDDPTVASIGASGIARGLAAGVVNLEAAYWGLFSNQAALQVVDFPISLSATPDSARVYREQGGHELPFIVERTIEDGSPSPPVDVVTDEVAWTSGAPFVAWVAPAVPPDLEPLLLTAQAGEAHLIATVGLEESNPVTVSVAEHLSITDQPQGAEKYIGESYTFTVETIGGFGTLSYTWRKNGEVLPGATTSSYIIPSLTVDDSGSYTVTVSDEETDVVESLTAELIVQPEVPLATFPIILSLMVSGLVAIWMVHRRNGNRENDVRWFHSRRSG